VDGFLGDPRQGPPDYWSKRPKFRGDVLLVSKNYTARALIYWNGKRYVWVQQGD